MSTRRDFIETSLRAGVGALAVPMLTGGNSIAIQDMMMRKIPSTGELLPVIGLGTWQTFDVGPTDSDRADVKAVLKEFVNLGGKVVDSSPMYGNSERVTGDLAIELGLLGNLFVATKVWIQGEKQGKNQMQDSMKLLRKYPIDLMQVHNLVDYSNHFRTLREWKEKRTVRYIGITHYTVDAFESLATIMRRDPIDFVQFNYSIETREAENLLLPLAAEKGIAVIVNRPFESGSIFQRVKGKALPEWASDFDCGSWGQFFLKFIVSHPSVTCAIPATSKISHLKDNMGANWGRLPDESTRRKMVDFMRTV